MTFQMYTRTFIKRISVLLICLFGWFQPGQGMDFVGKQVYARLGSSIEIKCPNRSLISTTAWFREKGILQISDGQNLNENIDKNRFRITGNFKLGEYNLELRNIQKEDFGIYVCTRALKDITFEFKLNLNLTKLPSDLHIYSFVRNTSQITSYSDQDATTIIGKENETLTLQCNLSSGVPKEDMMWSHRDHTIKKGGPGSLELMIKLKPSDSGIYACRANSSVLETPLVRIIALTVLYRPRVSINIEGRSNVIEGDTIVLYCNIDSNPKEVNISWFRIERHGGVELGTGTKLQLNVITRRDSGIYVCIAVNDIGKGLSKTSLTVMYAPDVTIQYQNITQDRGVRKLQCNPSGYPLQYTFYDWEHRSDYGDHIRFLTGSKNGILQFPASNHPYQDNGFYTCIVSNGIPHKNGMTRQSGSVYLNVKSNKCYSEVKILIGSPVFTAGNDPVFFGKLDEPIAISVNVFSRPKYSELLIQNQNGKRVPADVTNVKILEEHTYINDIIYNSKVKVKGYKITMKIANLRPDQIQKYTFTIKNEFGERQYNISVETESIIQHNSVEITTTKVSVVSVICLAVLIGVFLSCWLKKKKRIDINVSRQHMEDESPYDEIEVHEISEANANLPVQSSSSKVINIQAISSVYSENTDNRSAELSEDGSSSSDASRHTTDPKDIYSESYQALVGSTSQQMQVSRSYESLE